MCLQRMQSVLNCFTAHATTGATDLWVQPTKPLAHTQNLAKATTATIGEFRLWNAAQSNMAADSGMDTCPSPETPDSRKRPLDSEVENGMTKKSHYGGGK